MFFHTGTNRLCPYGFWGAGTKFKVVSATFADGGPVMKKILAAMLLLMLMLAPVAQARPINWQAELDRCRAMREQVEPLLLAGQGLSPIARSGTEARRCVWIVRRALRHGAR